MLYLMVAHFPLLFIKLHKVKISRQLPTVISVFIFNPSLLFFFGLSALWKAASNQWLGSHLLHFCGCHSQCPEACLEGWSKHLISLALSVFFLLSVQALWITQYIMITTTFNIHRILNVVSITHAAFLRLCHEFSSNPGAGILDSS